MPSMVIEKEKMLNFADAVIAQSGGESGSVGVRSERLRLAQRIKKMCKYSKSIIITYDEFNSLFLGCNGNLPQEFKD